ncbi:acyltransferase [Acidisoma cellulosilytica]|uniref:Acyltransferase n=1 Tax=Acidisoma cellulosilyticum TaxID=2802395 RepID=A0A963YZR6_9PROT|nr:acyltransferase [Acidisoma cellulosilyticum]MCB8879185.1 acyltransferase [Acidisoma cellulosilyticum]
MVGRFLALDGLRGLLALYILLGHTIPFLDLPPALAGLGDLLSHGRAAVALFFVLSGLVILGSIEKFATLPHPTARFLLARAGRLIPVYALALALAALALSLGDPFPAMGWLSPGGAAHDIVESGWPHSALWHVMAHALLLQGLLPPALLPNAEFSILGPAWSLSTEWQFYALAGLALASFGRRVTSTVGLRYCVTTLLLLGILGLGNDALPAEWQFGRAFLPQEAWYFALGIASFGLMRRPDDRAARILVALTLTASCIMSGVGTNPAAVLVPLAWVLCLICQNPTRAPSVVRAACHWGYRLLTSPILLWAGRMSYALYLTHAPVQRLLMLWLAPRADGDWHRFTLSFMGPAIALPLLVALVVHHRWEEPVRHWSQRRATAKDAFRLRPYASDSNTSAAGQP